MDADRTYGKHVSAYQQGELTEAESVKLFQRLIDTDAVWNLSDDIAYQALDLIEDGVCLPGTVSDSARANFQSLLSAAADNQLCLMSCLDREEQRCVPVICALNSSGDERELVPFAILLGHADPYERLLPPIREQRSPQSGDDE